AFLPAPPDDNSVPSMSNRTMCCIVLLWSRLNPGSQHFEKSRQPRRVRRPRRSGDEVAVDAHFVDGNLDVSSADLRDLRSDSRISGATPPAQNTGGCEQLQPVTDGRDRLVGFAEVPGQIQDARIEPQILRGAAAGNNQGIVVGGAHGVEALIEGEGV